MKILLLGSQHFKKAFEHLGHTVIGLAGNAAEQCDVRRHEADLIIVHESLGNRQLPHGIEKASVPTAFYSVDVHLNLFWHREYAQLFDYVFVSQKDYVGPLRHEQACWLPWSIDPGTFKDNGGGRPYDIVFVGTINSSRRKRKNILDGLAKRFDVRLFGTNPLKRLTHQEMAAIYSQAKIIVNESIYREVTFRTFEATACGGMLLAERVGNGLGDLFSDGTDIVMFDRHDLVEKADYYLQHDRERQCIAESGKQRAHALHTVTRRAEEMLRFLENNGYQKRSALPEKTALHYGKAVYFAGNRFPRHKDKRLKRAEILFKKALAFNSDNHDARLFLALAYAAQKKNEQATEQLQRVLRDCAKDDSYCRAALCSLAHALGHARKAREMLKNLQPSFSEKTGDFHMALGAVFEGQGAVHDAGYIGSNDIPLTAVDCYVAAGSSEGLYAAGLLLYMLSLFDGACEYLEKALGAEPQNRCIKKGLALAYLETYDVQGAFEQLKDVMNVRDVSGISELVQRARLQKDRRIRDIIDILEKNTQPVQR